MQLEGDIHGLRLLDLDAVGLSEYKSYLGGETTTCTSAAGSY